MSLDNLMISIMCDLLVLYLLMSAIKNKDV